MVSLLMMNLESRHLVMKYLEDFKEGQVIALGTYPVSEEAILQFGREFDTQSFHTDPEAAKQSAFGGLIASGWHTGSICMRLVCDAFLNQSACNGSPGLRDLQWLKPVRPGDVLSGEVRIGEVKTSTSKPDRGSMLQHWLLKNQNNESVFSCNVVVLMMRGPSTGLEAWRSQAQNLWFSDGGCTGGKAE